LSFVRKSKLKTVPKRTDLTPISEVVILAEQYLEEYNQRPHSGRGMEERLNERSRIKEQLSPREVFERALPPSERVIPDVLQMAGFFWRTEDRTVLRGGTVEIFGQIYAAANGDPIVRREMHRRIKGRVTVAYDPTNIGQAIALDDRGDIIGALECEALVEHGPTSLAMIGEELRTRRAMLRVIKQYRAAISYGVPSEKDFLRRRAGLPQTIEGDAQVSAPVVSSVSAARKPAAAPFLPTSLAVARKPAAAAPECIDDVAANVRGLLNAQETE
jgi:hypothetical protein